MNAKRNLIITAIFIAILIVCIVYTVKDGNVVAVTTSAKEGHNYKDLLDAIMWVESRGDANAVCSDGCCVGAYQLTEIYVDDCNRIMQLWVDTWREWADEPIDTEIRKAVPSQINGEDIYSFNYEDRWDKQKSRMITRIVTDYYANHDWYGKPHTQMQFLETAARTHKNPNKRNHPDTAPYWWKIRARLEAK